MCISTSLSVTEFGLDRWSSSIRFLYINKNRPSHGIIMFISLFFEVLAKSIEP
jgi:hypothetical protein